VRTVETLDQHYVLMPAAVKDAYLVHIVHEYLQKNDASSVMIFTNTCKSAIFFLIIFLLIHCLCLFLNQWHLLGRGRNFLLLSE